MPQRMIAVGKRLPRIRPLTCCLLLLFLESTVLLSQEASTMSTWRIRCDLNRDGVPDTLVGSADFNTRVTPYAVLWGRGQVTRITLPDWCSGGASVAPADSTSLLIAVSGRSPSSGADTVAAYLLDNQLDANSEWLLLGNAEGSVRALVAGRELRDPAVRDISGRVGFLVDPTVESRPRIERPQTSGVAMRLYPNPTSGVITVELAGNIGDGVTIDVYRLDGSLVLRKSLDAIADRTTIEINCSLLPVGRYQARLSCDGVALADHPFTIMR